MNSWDGEGDTRLRPASRLTDDALAHVVTDLERLVGGPLGIWRSVVLKRLTEIREILLQGSSAETDWLQPRRTTMARQRASLLDRVDAERHRVRTLADVESVSHDVRRLVTDVRHHLQRVHDVAWDEVEAEVGGSE